MHARVPGERVEHVLDFGERRSFQNGSVEFQLTLLPAGHIFGSAMALIEANGQRLLYTGDFKLRRGLSAEPCEPRHADILIMETTYGLPEYRFPSANDVMQGVLRFCREALDNDETPVLLGYSLGKSQELLCGLGDAGLPMMLHGAVHRLTQIYEQFGQCFPKYERYDAGTARGKVLLCPPNVVNSAMLRNLGDTRTAILTGWAVDPNCRFRYQCDAAFALSDHADFAELVELVKQVAPKKVYTLHGFAGDFAHTLRELGYDAQALSEDEQFALNLSLNPKSGSPILKRRDLAPALMHDASTGATSFLRFAQTCSAIAADRGKLEKTRFLAEYFRALNGDALATVATWFSGRPFPTSQNKVLNVGWAVLRDSMCEVGEVDHALLHQVYLKHSDLGETAFEILQNRPVEPSLSIEKVEHAFHRLYMARGPLVKRPILAGILARCTALEGKYLIKILTGDLRIGLKEGLVEDAVATVFNKSAEEIRQANLLLGDIGETARLASDDKLATASLVPFRPIKFMLASPEATAEDVWERVQGRTGVPPVSESCSERADALVSKDNSLSEPNGDRLEACPTVWLEDKYDGIRCQLHKVGGRVALYSRDLKEITATFPEIADAARRASEDFIFDGEILAMRGEEVLSFGELQKRLGRREADLFMHEEVPIQFVVFDLLWLNGATLLNRQLRERRQKAQSLTLPKAFRLARITEAKSVEEIEAAFSAARSRGNEGLMIKDPSSSYAPGRRGLAWLKLKKAFATLDCVVVGAEYGHGKRNQVLSDYTFAVRDEVTGELKTIGKAYSGLTDVEIAELTAHFLSTAIRQHGRYFEVPPDTVLEIAFDKIQPSSRHDSGLAMRFPRIVRIRTDKTASEIDTLATARKLAGL